MKNIRSFGDNINVKIKELYLDQTLMFLYPKKNTR